MFTYYSVALFATNIKHIFNCILLVNFKPKPHHEILQFAV